MTVADHDTCPSLGAFTAAVPNRLRPPRNTSQTIAAP